MIFAETKLQGAFEITLQPFTDDRGWFARYFCAKEFGKLSLNSNWVQMNHSYSKFKGTLRGLHFQKAPHREIKLVRCIAGRVFDVIVDLRENSPQFLQWTGVELSPSKNNMIYIPEGFAHGFQCLENNCELLYHHSAFFNPEAESGIRYDDPALNIIWPLAVEKVSERDQLHQYINESFKGI